MSRKIEAVTLARYRNPIVIEHLASNYVMGLLSQLVTKRLDALRASYDYPQIESRISYWEQKLSPLDNRTPELVPMPQTWQKIQQQLNLRSLQNSETPTRLPLNERFKWLAFLKMQMPGMAAIAFCFVMAFVVVKSNETGDALSYLAVLQDSDQTPQVVAVTYGNSKKLALDIMALPNIDSQQSYELWVTSKTDKQARSLGQIPKNLANFEIQLSEAQWRLIVDSADLLISVEDLGGSAIGEPSEFIVSRGLCIRLSGWQNDA